MRTPHLTGVVASLEEAEASMEAADVNAEAPQPIIGLWLIQVRNLRRLVEHHEVR